MSGPDKDGRLEILELMAEVMARRRVGETWEEIIASWGLDDLDWAISDEADSVLKLRGIEWFERRGR